MGIEHEEISEKERGFKFPPENAESGLESKESNFEVEIKKEDISGIENRMDDERHKEGLNGAQSLAFEGAALSRLRKEAPEAGISKVEMSDADWKRSKERLERDLSEVESKKRKEGEKNGWDEDRIRQEIELEEAWINLFQKSYLIDINQERFENDKDLKVTNKEWDGYVKDLKRLIEKGDWHNFIPRAGHMHNLAPERFEKYVSSLSPEEMDKIEDGIVGEIEVLKNGDPGAGKEGRREPNSWELASRFRYAFECFSGLKGKVEVSKKDRKNMNDRLEKARQEGNYWAVSYQLCNMKVLENMIKRGEVKSV